MRRINMAAKKKIRKQDKSISTFLNEWAEVIQNLPKYTYVNDKIAIVRAVKVLSEEMQNVAKKAGYKPDDMLFITMEKIEGGMVIKGSVAKCESDELVIKKVD
jgi:hypothetical protein